MADGTDGPIRDAVLVVNPAAGGGAVLRHREPVLDALRGTGWRVAEVVTTGMGHAVRVASDATPGTVLASLGGDGLHARLAQGAMTSGARLAPLPGGRGNDLVRALGLSGDPAAVAATLPGARERRIDVGLVDGHAFLGVASVGFDTAANRYANALPALRGAAVYTAGGVAAWLTQRPRRLDVTTGDGVAGGSLWNVSVGNTGRYGGGLRVCPDAVPDDGRLDLVTVDGRIGRIAFARVLLGMFSGRHVRRPGVTSRRVSWVEVRSEVPLPVYADGDPVATTPVRIEVRPGALRLLA